MKRSIRKGLFETNSSSVHTLCVDPKDIKTANERTIHFGFGAFGWGPEVLNSTQDKANYMWTRIYYLNPQLRDEYVKKLFAVMVDNNVKYTFTSFDEFEFDGSDCYIDHPEDNCGVFDIIENNEVMQFLFNDSSNVILDNDNSGFEDFGVSPVTHYKSKNFKIY